MEKNTELFAIIELFGHTKMAGKVSEHNFGSNVFIRVDVPETDSQPGFTRMVNPSAVYALNPVTEEVMHDMANTLKSKPIEAWDIREMFERLKLQLPSNTDNHE